MENVNLDKAHIEIGEENVDIIKHTFKKSVIFEGTEYKDITLNLEGITGKDIKDVTIEIALQGIPIGVAETNKTFLSALAAKSANLPSEFMDYIPGKEFSAITMLVQNFLLG